LGGIGHEVDGRIDEGTRADLAVIDPSVQWTVSGAAMASRSRNTPYEGRLLTGRVRHTIHRGEIVVMNGEAQR
jgi:dihydroorotase